MERSWITFLSSYRKCLFCNTDRDLCQWFCGCSFRLEKQTNPKPEPKVSGPVFIWLWFSHLKNAKGKLETSPIAFPELITSVFAECLSRLFTLLWKLIWMKSLYCSPVILRMDPKWKLWRSLPLISESVVLFLQLTNTQKRKTFMLQFFMHPFKESNLVTFAEGFLPGIKSSFWFGFAIVSLTWYKMLPLTTSLVLPEQHAAHFQFKDW